MLKLIDITKEYRLEDESLLALHNLSVTFRRNEFVSILGPSGCGKTTLLNIIGGLDRYTSGDIQVEGVSTEDYDDLDWDTYRNQRIGFVFQSYNLIPHISVLKNVQLTLTLAGVGKDESRERALEALRRVGLEKQAKKRPSQLSGGQMQRVAIARAIVGDPEIILADEPTGALDSESGVQVMELLKEVARDRLVIMVTHNGQLAEEYSTRIINLRDGEIVGDTMPYTDEEEAAEEEFMRQARAAAEQAFAADEKQKDDGSAGAEEYERLVARRGLFATAGIERGAEEKKGFAAFLKAKVFRRKLKEKSSMSLGTAISLSWTNLFSKKGRTMLTSFAGSIGIIGILLVLTLSGGVGNYINMLEENALSQYPITIDRQAFDMTAILEMLASQNDPGEEYPDDGVITPGKFLGNITSNIGKIFGTNDLAALKEYLDENFDHSLGTVTYDYGSTMNIYAPTPGDSELYMKLNPFTDAMSALFEENPTLGGLQGSLEALGDNIGAGWDEISTNQTLLDQQYDVIGGKWPESANEIVVVVDKYNQVPDYALLMLGLKAADDIWDALGGENSGFYTSYTIDDILNLRYKLFSDGDYYYLDDEATDKWTNHLSGTVDSDIINEMDREAGSIELKVVGVVRPKEGVNVTSINGYLGYTQALTHELLAKAERSPVAEQFYAAAREAAGLGANEALTEENFSYYGFTSPATVVKRVKGEDGTVTETTVVAKGDKILSYDAFLGIVSTFGCADERNPSSIRIKCSSFDSKAEVERLIDEFTAETGKNIMYSDTLGMIMSFVEQMANTMTNVLVGFAAISLIVSTIMIAIIIYTSVLERRKEIGVLRSLGARKKDISRVFTAESAMIGAFSGFIGVIMSLAFSAIGNAVLAFLVKIQGLMAPTWWHYLLMFFVSILLAVVAGFAPSRVAAKKDPTVALRSE